MCFIIKTSLIFKIIRNQTRTKLNSKFSGFPILLFERNRKANNQTETKSKVINNRVFFTSLEPKKSKTKQKKP